MALTGLLTNFDVAIDRAARERAKALVLGLSGPTAEPFRPRQGALRAAVIAVLENGEAPLCARDVQLLVESQLGYPVKLHSVITCLTKGVDNPRSPIIRVAKGLYRTEEAHSRPESQYAPRAGDTSRCGHEEARLGGA